MSKRTIKTFLTPEQIETMLSDAIEEKFPGAYYDVRDIYVTRDPLNVVIVVESDRFPEVAPGAESPVIVSQVTQVE